MYHKPFSFLVSLIFDTFKFLPRGNNSNILILWLFEDKFECFAYLCIFKPFKIPSHINERECLTVFCLKANIFSCWYRIYHWGDQRGGLQPLTWALFGENICKNERIGFCWGVTVPVAPLMFQNIRNSLNLNYQIIWPKKNVWKCFVIHLTTFLMIRIFCLLSTEYE